MPGAQESAAASARTLRARLGEMSQPSASNLPVYVLFTKMDRLPFFAEYVRNLTKEEAGQVLGATIPCAMCAPAASMAKSRRRASPPISNASSILWPTPGPIPGPRGRCHQTTRRLRVPARVPQDPSRRGAVPGDICQPSQLTVGPFLRGFYFTGVRPIVINEVAPVAAAQPQAGYGPAAGATGLFRAGQAAPAPPAAPQVGATRRCRSGSSQPPVQRRAAGR